MTNPYAATARRLGFDPERLSRIGDFLDETYIAPGLLPCAQVAVVRKGETVWRSMHGQADPERGKSIAEDTIFRIYSMTKPVVSLAFMMLVEEGKVSLDDPVHRFIPAWKGMAVHGGGALGERPTTPTAAPMRMVDLLRHTSGLTYTLQNSNAVDEAHRRLKLGVRDGPMDLEQTITALAQLSLIFSPGTAWNYSVSTDVIAYLVGAISGMPFQDFLKTRIFTPLGMGDTDFYVPADQAHRLAACYAMTPDGQRVLQDDAQTSPYLAPPRYYSGGAGLVSTLDDYLKFTQMLVNGGELNGQCLIAPKTLALMATNHLPDNQDLTRMSVSLFSESTYAGTGFGLGFAVVMDPAKGLIASSPGEFYWGGYASTAFWIDPVEEISVVFLTQLAPSNTYPVRRQLRTLVYSALMEPNSVAVR